MNMTNTQREAAKDLDEARESYLEEILESAAKWGLIRDTGERKWSPATCSYQIVWEPVPGKLPSDFKTWHKFRTSLLRARRSAAP
jgi:hypothetical protein